MNSKHHHELASKAASASTHRDLATFGPKYLQQGAHVFKVLGALGMALKARKDFTKANHPRVREALDRAERLVGKWLTDCLEHASGANLVHAVADGIGDVEAKGLSLLELPGLVFRSKKSCAFRVADACKALEEQGIDVPTFVEAPPRDPARQRVATEVAWRETYQKKVRMSLPELRALFQQKANTSVSGFIVCAGDGLGLRCPSDDTLRRMAKEMGIVLLAGKRGAPKGQKQNRVRH